MRRVGRAVILALALHAVAPLAGAGQEHGPAEETGAFTWREEGRDFGGFSALELSEDGRDFLTVTDSGDVLTGRLLRDAAGAVTAIEHGPFQRLKSAAGERLRWAGADAEGVALAPDGGFYVSFEDETRVAYYAGPDATAQTLPIPAAFRQMPTNKSLEALSIDASGTLWIVPETVPEGESYPLYRYRDGVWDQPFSLPIAGAFRPVGADFGPDGRYYLLERALTSIFGFRSRLRVFDWTEDGPVNGRVLFESSAGTYDNLEGLAIWRDAEGNIRATMVSDDNFKPFQKTQLVDWKITGN